MRRHVQRLWDRMYAPRPFAPSAVQISEVIGMMRYAESGSGNWLGAQGQPRSVDPFLISSACAFQPCSLFIYLNASITTPTRWWCHGGRLPSVGSEEP